MSIEISAPGLSIWTTTHSSKETPYEYASGTSVSAPIISATVALVLGYASRTYGRILNPAEVRYILRESATDLSLNGWDPYYGYGIVNAYNALQKVDELLGNGAWIISLDPLANLDLHIYDAQGHHVGLDYATGQLQLQIPNAIHT